MKQSKQLGFWSVVLLAINLIVGSGIFLSPGAVIGIAGKYTPIVYLVAALFASALAISFASAAKYVNQGGAAYAYTTAAFGENIGFYVGIAQFIAGSIAWGVMATAVVKTVILILGYDNRNFFLITFGILILMGIIFLINISGTYVFKFVNNLSTIGKMLALLTTIVAGVVIIMMTGKSHFNEIDQVVDTSHMNSGTFVMAIIAAFYAFTGFENVANGSKDMKDPQKTLPKAIPLAIIIIEVVYFGIIMTIMCLNPKAIMHTHQVVSLVAVFQSPVIYHVILYGALISMFGINVATSFSIPRMVEAVAAKGQIPKWFGHRTKQGFPIHAFFATAIVAILLPMSFGFEMTSIIVLSSISRFVQFLVVPVAVMTFYFGKSHDDVLTNVKKNFFTDMCVPVIALLVTTFILFRFDWQGEFSIKQHGHMEPNYYAIIAMVIGYVVLPIVLFVMKEKRKKKERAHMKRTEVVE